jgi:hypothetical protein
MKVSGGYTIIEVMVVIGIAAVIFFSAMTAIGGRQQSVQFAQAVREFDAKIRDVINDVTTGYFPTNNTITCTLLAGVPQITVDSDAKLGTNNDCIFIGKAIQFQPNGVAERMDIYSLAGLRFQDNDQTPTETIAKAQPVPIARPGDDANFKDATESYDLLYGLRVKKVMRPLGIVPPTYGLVGIISNFGTGGISDAQTVQVGGIYGSQTGANESTTLRLLDALTDDPTRSRNDGYIEKNTLEGIVICLENQAGKKASLTFGAKGTAATKLDIDTYDRKCDI